MFLYIRHAEKQYSNSLELGLDPALTPYGEVTAKSKFVILYEQYGTPDIILCSPYLRARQTAEIAQTVLANETKVTVPINCELGLSEYLSLTRYKPSDLESLITTETLRYGVISPELLSDFETRVLNYQQQLNKTYIGKKVWLICHGLFMLYIAKSQQAIVTRPPYLATIPIYQ